LLLAAAAGELTMADVVRWTNAADFDQPASLLHLAGEADAALALAACEARDARIQSSVATTLETVLAPFEDPVVAHATQRSDIDLDALLDQRGSLYLCGPSHEQHRIQGLFAALVSSAVAAAIRRAGDTTRPLDPPLLLVLDEVANIAPIRDLDTLASTAAGVGVQLVTVCQDLAQLGHRYGAERARTIANNHRAKILLSGVSDLTTLDLVSGLAGEEAVREDTVTHELGGGRRSRSSAVAFRRLAPTDALRRIPPGAGVLVYGHLPPVRLHLRPWFADRDLRRRAGTAIS
jgi:type IV secretion system protein VirD4